MKNSLKILLLIFFTSISIAIDAAPWITAKETQADMAYVSSTVTQVTNYLLPGASYKPVIAIEVQVTGTTTPLTLESFSFNRNGSTTISDITKAHVFYTSTYDVFDDTTQFGSSIILTSDPFSATGSQQLKEGTNYFWLTFDIDPGATINNIIDAECLEITIDGVNHTPTVTAPAGNRYVKAVSDLADFVGNENPALCSSAPDYKGSLNIDHNRTQSVSAYIGESAFWDFQSNGTEQFTFNTCGKDAETYIRIYDNDLNQIAFVDNDGPLCGGNSASIEWNASVPGNYYVTVTRYPCQALDEDISMDFFKESNHLTFESASVTQNSEKIYHGDTTQVIIGVEIECSGEAFPFSATEFNFSTVGSTAASDILKAELFYTGTTANFAADNQFGEAVSSPDGAFTVNGNQQLASGTNYFWLTYDIAQNATTGNVVDASCNAITINSISQTPTPTAPTGNRVITDMEFESINISQVGNRYLLKGSVNNPILLIDINTIGLNNALVFENIKVNSLNSDDTDISALKLFYSTTPNFNDTVQVGTNQNFVSDTASFSFLGLNLAANHNYIWICADIATSALESNIIDMSVLADKITISSQTYPAAEANPDGRSKVAFDAISSYPYSESFENTTAVWMQSDNDQIDWTLQTGETPSSNTGPGTASDGSYYLFTESTFHAEDTAKIDAIFDFTTLTEPKLMFDYHMFGSTMGSLHVDIFDGTWQKDVFSISGEQHTASTDNWTTQTVDLDIYGGHSNIIIRFRAGVGSDFFSDISLDYVRVIEGPNMQFTSVEAAQPNTNDIPLGSTNQEILQVVIETTNAVNPLPITSFQFNTNGTTNTSDITQAKVYSTGNSSALDTSVIYGTAALSPDGTFSINGNKALQSGTNYFWLVYDISPAATIGHVVDAEFNKIVVDNADQTPTTTAPTGNRAIDLIYCESIATQSSGIIIKHVEIRKVLFQTSTSNCATYTDNTGVIDTLVVNNNFNFILNITTCDTEIEKAAKVFIDYNRNGSFEDAGEEAASIEPFLGEKYDTISVHIPTDAYIGKTQMRVVAMNTNTLSDINPCGTYTNGETQDFSLVFRNNQTPVIVNAIADVEEYNDFGIYKIIIDNVFSDPDNDSFSVKANTSDNSIVDVSIDADTLFVTEKGIGSAQITVVADDSFGGTVSDVFAFTVVQKNRAPEIANPIDDLHEKIGFAYLSFNLNYVFTDLDDDPLTYSANSDNTDVTVIEIRDNEFLVLNESTSDGTANITVTATDPDGLSATDEFVLEVENNPNDILDLAAAGFKIYPNPAENGIIYIEKATNSTANIKIIDLKGQVHYSETMKDQKQAFNLHGKSGIFFVLIDTNHDKYVQRIVVK